MIVYEANTLVELSLEELKKAVETLHSISCSPGLPLVSLQLDRNTVYIFCFLRISEFSVVVIKMYIIIVIVVFDLLNLLKHSSIRIVNVVYMRNKFLPAGTLFASRYSYIFYANRDVIIFIAKISGSLLVINCTCIFLRGYGLEGVSGSNDAQDNDQSSQHGKKATSCQKPKQQANMAGSSKNQRTE